MAQQIRALLPSPVRATARLLCVLFLGVWLAVPAALADGVSDFATHVNEDGSVAVPKYLFHWSSLNGMIRAAKREPGSAVLPMKEAGDSMITKLDFFPPDTKVLFAWTHPTAAMAVNENEEYARGPSPVLLMMKPNAKASVVVLNTVGDQPNLGLNLSKAEISAIKDADLVLHVYRDQKGDPEPRFREWIVQNPKAIEWYSADPRDFPEEVKQEIAAAPQKPLEKDEAFYRYYVSDDAWLRKHQADGREELSRDELKRYSTLKPEDVPPEYRLHESHPGVSGNSCEGAFRSLGLGGL